MGFSNMGSLNEKIYNSYNLNFFIICPSRDKKIFELFKNKNVSIINEDEIIAFSNFKNIFNLYMKKSPYFNQIQSRVSWYYQQCLKISFIFSDLLDKSFIASSSNSF